MVSMKESGPIDPVTRSFTAVSLLGMMASNAERQAVGSVREITRRKELQVESEGA